MKPTRRAVLTGTGTAIAAGLAGCGGGGEPDDESDGGGDGGGTPTETEEPTPTATPAQQVLVDDSVHLTEGGYESWEWYSGSPCRLEYEFTVTQGPAIDAFVIPIESYSNYESQQSFDQVAESLDRESDSATVELEVGTYYFVVDHTSMGRAQAPDELGQHPADVDVYAAWQEL